VAKPTRVTNRIGELRAAIGLTQADLGDRIGVTRQTVNAIEGGKYSPSLDVAFRIAGVLGTSLEVVFQYDEVGRRARRSSAPDGEPAGS
jgi:putative transcriptional regulator